MEVMGNVCMTHKTQIFFGLFSSILWEHHLHLPKLASLGHCPLPKERDKAEDLEPEFLVPGRLYSENASPLATQGEFGSSLFSEDSWVVDTGHRCVLRRMGFLTFRAVPS